MGGGGRRAPPPWILLKQKQWEEEGCNCPLQRGYGNRNNGRSSGGRAPPSKRLWKQKQWEELRRESAPSKEVMETETMGGVHEGERPLQRGYGNRNNGRSLGGRATPQRAYGNRNNGRSSGGRAPPPKRLWKQKQWEEFMRESAPSSPVRLW